MVLISELEAVHKISTKVSSFVPKPSIAWCISLARYSGKGIIIAIINSSNLPLNSLFKSDIRS